MDGVQFLEFHAKHDAMRHRMNAGRSHGGGVGGGSGEFTLVSGQFLLGRLHCGQCRGGGRFLVSLFV